MKQPRKIPKKLAPKKIWKHFYSPREQWGQLTDLPIELMKSETEYALGCHRVDSKELPEVDKAQWELARLLFAEHHKEAYAPIYLRERAHPKTKSKHTCIGSMRPREKALSIKGVIIITEYGDSPFVVTAFRAVPPRRATEFSVSEFYDASLHYYNRSGNREMKEMRKTLIESLRRHVSLPTSQGALWSLVRDIAIGQVYLESESIELRQAQSLFSTINSAEIKLLTDSLDWEGVIERLKASVMEDDELEIESALIDVEQLAALGELLHLQATVRELLDEASEILSWLSVDSWSINRIANQNLKDMVDQSSNVARLWLMVLESHMMAVADEEAHETATYAETPITDLLFPPEEVDVEAPWLSKVRALISTHLTNLRQQSDEVLNELLNAVVLSEPNEMSVMLSGASPNGNDDEYEILLSIECTPPEGDYRVYIIDEDNPEGCDVTESYRVAGDTLWELRWGERALVVIISSSSTLDISQEETFASYLSRATAQGEVSIVSKLVYRDLIS